MSETPKPKMVAYVVMGGRGGGKTARVIAALRERVETHGSKSVLICSASPAAVALGQELGVRVVDPKAVRPWRSIFELPR